MRVHLSERIADTDPAQLGLFVAGIAERLMDLHEALPDEEQIPSILEQRPLLAAVWSAACGEPTAHVAVCHALARVYLSDFLTPPPDAGRRFDHAGRAVYYSAQLYLHLLPQFAIWVSNAAIEFAGWSASIGEAEPVAATAQERQRQHGDLDLIAEYVPVLRELRAGDSPGATRRLVAELKPRLIRATGR